MIQLLRVKIGGEWYDKRSLVFLNSKKPVRHLRRNKSVQSKLVSFGLMVYIQVVHLMPNRFLHSFQQSRTHFLQLC